MGTLSNTVAPPDLARAAVEGFVRERLVIDPPAMPEGILALRAGAFVTIRTTGGALRGCIGTVTPSCGTIAEEIIQNAISAAIRDPRFPPVAPDELGGLTYGVDVLMPPEPARGVEDLDPSIYGVIIESVSGHRRGLLLPDITGIDTPEQQWRAVHQKAGIPVGEPVRVERFRVTRFGKD
ncbi:MAG TPA: AmmeMemoRadiSam system protein A [Blastocatellia bacterium]|nr:AmmeMemoRadiSam system protein A [Blastocatellia bacterium]